MLPAWSSNSKCQGAPTNLKCIHLPLECEQIPSLPPTIYGFLPPFPVYTSVDPYLCIGAHELRPLQVVPQGIESVNGSTMNMGCPTELENINSTNRSCGALCDPSASYMVDGESPTLNMSTSNWASHLVTVRKNLPIHGRLSYDHVLLTFVFDTLVVPSSVELDFVHCPEWNIDAPGIDVYSDNDTDRDFDVTKLLLRGTWPPVSDRVYETSCDSLSTVQIPLTKPTFHFRWFIVVSFTNDEDIEWVHIGEIRFLNVSKADDSFSFCNHTSPVSSSSLAPLSTVLIPSLSPSPTLFPSLGISSAVSPTTAIIEHSPLYTVQHSPLYTVQHSPSHTPGKWMLPPDVGDPIVTSVPSPRPKLPLKYIFIAGAAAIVLAVGLLFVVLCYVSCRHRSKVRRSRLGGPLDENNFQSMPLPPTPSDSPNSINHPISSTNALQHSPDSSPSYDRESVLYELIPAEQMSPLLNEGKVPICMDTPIDSESATAACSVSSTGFLDAANGCDSEPLVPNSTDPETADIYIDMQSPCHSVSVDVEHILSRRVFVNEGIYSEQINPSDFASRASATHREGLKSGEDFEFLSPVYPTLSTLPEGLRTIIEVSGDNIKEISQLRVGQFGKAIQASTINLSLRSIGLSKMDDDRSRTLLVAVKMFCPHPSQFHVEQEAFNRETKFLSQLKHANVLRFLGVCYFNPVFIMMEYMVEGDLNSFLQKYSEIVPIITPSSKNQVTTSTLVYIASQVANAMCYLANLNFIHRDLATRNCYIEANTVVKVGDLGVDMNRYKSHYYPIHGKTLLPIRWMATECFSGKFSEKSDVWAFGVTMWELFTLAKDLPYPHLSDEEVVGDLIQNSLGEETCQLLLKPAACTQPLFEIIQRCWVHNRKKRATFSELHKLLQMHL